MEEVVKEEPSRAACQLSPQTLAAGSCHGDRPLCWTASAVALHRDVEGREERRWQGETEGMEMGGGRGQHFIFSVEGGRVGGAYINT